MFPDREKTASQPRPSPSNLTRAHFVIELEENPHEVLFIPSSLHRYSCVLLQKYRGAVLDGFGIALLHSDYVPCCPSKFRKKILKHIYHPYFIPYLLISLGLSSFGYLHKLDPPADDEYSL